MQCRGRERRLLCRVARLYLCILLLLLLLLTVFRLWMLGVTLRMLGVTLWLLRIAVLLMLLWFIYSRLIPNICFKMIVVVVCKCWCVRLRGRYNMIYGKKLDE